MIMLNSKRRRRKLVDGTATTMVALTLTFSATQVPAAFASDAVKATAQASSVPAAASGSALTAANLPEVRMVCAEGQTNINLAPVNELAGALKVDVPVAERVVTWRPFLQVSDLSVVEGIGPGRLAAIIASSKACATPTMFPPPAPNVCNANGKIDLAVSPVADLAARLKISKPVAQRLVDARPYASLRHVTPERVGGVGKGTLEAVIAKSCLTPAPIRSAASSWRWTYPGQTITVSRDLYGLTVPAGVVDAASGAWASIEPGDQPTKMPEPYIPNADMHIWGPWADGEQTVTVTLPSNRADFPDDDSDTYYDPYILHSFADTSNGPGGESLTASLVGNGTQLSAPVHSLSNVATAWIGKSYTLLSMGAEVTGGILFGDRFFAPACSTPWAQRAGTSIFDPPSPQKTWVDIHDAFFNLPGNIRPVNGFLFKHCVGAGAPVPPATQGSGQDAARTVVRNNSSTIVRWRENAGANAFEVKRVLPDTDLTAYAIRAFAGAGDSSGLITFPGDDIAIDVRPGTTGTADHRGEMGYTFAKFGLDSALSELNAVFSKLNIGTNSDLFQTVIDGISCALPVLASVSAPDVPTALVRFSSELHACLEDSVITILDSALRIGVAQGRSVGELDDLHKRLTAFRDKVRYLKYAGIIRVAAEGLSTGFNTIQFRADHYRPAPTVDGRGRTVQGHCIVRAGSVNPGVDEACQDDYYSDLFKPVTGGGGDTGLPAGYILQDPNEHSYFVSTVDGTIRSIPTPGDYVCIAQAGYPVRFNTYPKDLLGLTQSDAPFTCPSNATDYIVTRQKLDELMFNNDGSSANTLRLLRAADGTVYIYIGDGVLANVPTSEQFNCWTTGTHRYMAFDYIDRASDLGGLTIRNDLLEHCIR